MKREGFTVPLLIGGATTSKMHTAVKIQPQYRDSIHVLDASKAVVVVSSLLSEAKQDYLEDVREQYGELRDDYYAGMKDRVYKSLADARSKGLKINFTTNPPSCKPKFLGTRSIEVDLERLVESIDWNPFFAAWQVRGKYPNRDYPKIFRCESVGAEAKKLFDDAQEMIREVLLTRQFRARGVVSLYAANSQGDDILVYTDDTRAHVAGRFCGLRQQADKDEGDDTPFMCLSDFVAPVGVATDYVGTMAVAVFGCESLCARYDAENDSYRSIMAKALADRFAEAFAEEAHRIVRTDWWGYAKGEGLDAKEMHQLQYHGIRPAPGYPSQPDHTEKSTLWALGEVKERSGIELTDGSYAMNPAAAVCALLIGHSQAKYFATGKIQKDQVVDYAARKGMTVEAVERNLGSILAYDP